MKQYEPYAQNRSCLFEVHTLITLLIYCGGLLSAVIATACVSANGSIDYSLKAVLLSFCIANIFGSSVFVYDVKTIICPQTNHLLDNFNGVIAQPFFVTDLALLSHSYYQYKEEGK